MREESKNVIVKNRIMKNFVYVLLFVGNWVFASLILLSFKELTFNEWFSVSSIIAYFHTKSIIDKQDLENKLFELKQLIENKKILKCKDI